LFELSGIPLAPEAGMTRAAGKRAVGTFPAGWQKENPMKLTRTIVLGLVFAMPSLALAEDKAAAPPAGAGAPAAEAPAAEGEKKAKKSKKAKKEEAKPAEGAAPAAPAPAPAETAPKK
jgi:hypothetical protein